MDRARLESAGVSGGFSVLLCRQMLDEDGRHGVTGWVSSWLGGRGPQSVPNTPQRPTSGQALNSVRKTKPIHVSLPVSDENSHS